MLLSGPTTDEIETFERAYIEALIWTATTEAGETLDQAGYDGDDLSDEARQSIREDVEDFLGAHVAIIRELDYKDDHGYGNIALAGHDFLLTRQGQGVGFWDRGLGEIGQSLTLAAHVYGDTSVWVSFPQFDMEHGILELEDC